MLSTKDKKEAVMQKFDKQAFIAEVKDNVKKLYRKNIEEADKQQIFQAVSYAVKDTIIDNWMMPRKSTRNRIRNTFTICPWSS